MVRWSLTEGNTLCRRAVREELREREKERKRGGRGHRKSEYNAIENEHTMASESYRVRATHSYEGCFSK